MIRNKLEAFGSSNQHVRLMTSNELDKCLREALYTDNVGCSDSILFDISQATYHDGFFERIMKAAWRCVSSRPGRARRIQKGLNLLNYLAINGSEKCIADILRHMDTLHAVTKLKFSQGNKEVGLLVVEKAVQLSSLVLETRTLQDKRRYAASIRDRFVSVGSTNGMVETEVLHKPVYVLDRTKNPTSPMYNTTGVGGLGSIPMGPPHHSGSGRKFLSKLFKNNLKISNRPQNIGLYGNNLPLGSSRSNPAPGFDLYGRVTDPVGDSFRGQFDDNFNAFPEVNNTNDSYYQHNFSRYNERKLSDQKFYKSSRNASLTEDSSFKPYTSTSETQSSSESESYDSSSTTSERSSSSGSRYRRNNRSQHRTRHVRRVSSSDASSSSSSPSDYSSSPTYSSYESDHRRRSSRRPPYAHPGRYAPPPPPHPSHRHPGYSSYSGHSDHYYPPRHHSEARHAYPGPNPFGPRH